MYLCCDVFLDYDYNDYNHYYYHNHYYFNYLCELLVVFFLRFPLPHTLCLKTKVQGVLALTALLVGRFL